MTSDPSKANDYKYDVVTGVSAGSINAVVVAAWPIGQEKEMAEWASSLWAKLRISNVFENWKPAGIVTGVLEKSGIFNDEPLMELMQTVFDEREGKMYKRFVVSCVNSNTGEIVLFDETNPDIPKASVSSSSIPAVFPTRHWAADLQSGYPEDVTC